MATNKVNAKKIYVSVGLVSCAWDTLDNAIDGYRCIDVSDGYIDEVPEDITNKLMQGVYEVTFKQIKGYEELKKLRVRDIRKKRMIKNQGGKYVYGRNNEYA